MGSLLSSNYKLRAGLNTLNKAYESASITQKQGVEYSTHLFINEVNYSIEFTFTSNIIIARISTADTVDLYVLHMDTEDFVHTDFTNDDIEKVFESLLIPITLNKAQLFSFSRDRAIEDLKALNTNADFLDLIGMTKNLMELVSNNDITTVKDYRREVKKLLIRNRADLNKYQLKAYMDCGKEFSEETTILFSALKQLHLTLNNHNLLDGLLSGIQH